ncbi:MAG: hypothetical protein IJV72_01510, partial [Clostridia bacterium]|nr:hypothetical protein [Clostridia bacterium]
MKNIEFKHKNILINFIGGDDASVKMSRFEPIDYKSLVKNNASFEPFILKTSKSTAAPMEGCDSIPTIWDGSPCEIVEQNEKGITLKYLKDDNTLEITVCMEFIEGADIIRQTNTVKNISDDPITLTHFSSGMVCGIGMGGELDRWNENKTRVHYCLSHWCSEAQWRDASLEDVGIYRQSMHNWDISSF